MVCNMKLKVFSVFDTKLAVFGNPWFDQRVESAIRAFTDAVNSPGDNNMWNKHPEDFSLYLLGEFDNDTGTFDLDKPRNLLTASSIRRSPQMELFEKQPAVN